MDLAVVRDVGGHPVHVGEGHEAHRRHALVCWGNAVQQFMGHREDEGPLTSQAQRQPCKHTSHDSSRCLSNADLHSPGGRAR